MPAVQYCDHLNVQGNRELAVVPAVQYCDHLNVQGNRELAVVLAVCLCVHIFWFESAHEIMVLIA